MGAHVSLFAGIGCDFLGSRAQGFTPVAHSEIEPHLRAHLSRRFPRTLDLGDVREVRAGDIAKGFGSEGTLISGGFPCQDISAPGYGPHRTGGDALDGTRSGLYVELMRVVREAQPEYVMIENVALLKRRGLHVLLHDLWEAGYDALWDSIPAAYVGAPHLRDRLFIAARLQRLRSPEARRIKLSKVKNGLGAVSSGGVFGNGAPVTSFPRAGMMQSGLVSERTPILVKDARAGRNLMPTPTASDGTGGPGTSPRREGGKNLRTYFGGSLNPPFVEWMMGVPEGWTDPSVTNNTVKPFAGWDNWPSVPSTIGRMPGRGRRIKALGNALVPQAFELSLSRIIDW